MLANKLQQLRTEKKMTKAAFANFLDIPYTTYNGYESGNRYPNYQKLKDIAKKLEVSTDYLLGTSNEKSGKTKSDALSLLTSLGYAVAAAGTDEKGMDIYNIYHLQDKYFFYLNKTEIETLVRTANSFIEFELDKLKKTKEIIYDDDSASDPGTQRDPDTEK